MKGGPLTSLYCTRSFTWTTSISPLTERQMALVSDKTGTNLRPETNSTCVIRQQLGRQLRKICILALMLDMFAAPSVACFNWTHRSI